MYFVIMSNSLIFSKKSHEEHVKWIPCKHRESHKEMYEMYGDAYMKYSPEKTCAEFRKKVNMVPWDIMRLVILHKIPLVPC
jgi:hypothetical protein